MAVVGGSLSISLAAVVMMAPVRVPILQIASLALLSGVIIYVFRMSRESVKIEHQGITVVPAFGKTCSISWNDLAAIDSATRPHHPKSSDTHALSEGLWDLDIDTQPREIQTYSLVTRTNRVIPLPVSDDRTLRLIHEAWGLATRTA